MCLRGERVRDDPAWGYPRGLMRERLVSHLGMRAHELLQCYGKLLGMPHVTALMRPAYILGDHRMNCLAAGRLVEEKVTERCSSNVGNVLVLSEREHLISG